jgi:hypothetical protein
LDGGRLCLDFVNDPQPSTIHNRYAVQVEHYLQQQPQRFIEWCVCCRSAAFG